SSRATMRATSRALSLRPMAVGRSPPDRRSGMRRLEGRRAIVTGGGSGIGRARPIRFAREGASVLVVGRAANTMETVDLIHAEDGKALGMLTDAAVEANVEAMVQR